MRYRHGKDVHHDDVLKGLQKIYGEAAVIDTAGVGDDFPDMVLGARGRTLLIEVKTCRNKKRTVTRSQVTDGQRRLSLTWAGDALLQVIDLEDALRQLRQLKML